MKQLLIVVTVLTLLTGSALGQKYNRFGAKQGRQQRFNNSWNNNHGYIQPYKPNAYGPGINSDATGRPFKWETQNKLTVPPSSKVKPNAYGPGIGMDEYGRPVKPSPWGQ